MVRFPNPLANERTAPAEGLTFFGRCSHAFCLRSFSVVQYPCCVGLSLDEAFAFFYGPFTYQLMREGVSDVHARSNGYLVDELILEQRCAEGRGRWLSIAVSWVYCVA